MKYELLALFPLTATDEELKTAAGRVEERLKAAGATIASSAALQKSRLAYPILQARQGYYHLIQFELDPKAVAELKRTFLLSGQMLRFTIEKKQGNFKPFIPTPPKVMTARASWAPRKVAVSPIAAAVAPYPAPTTPAAPKTLAQEPAKGADAPKVTMEEIDKRLEEILGE